MWMHFWFKLLYLIFVQLNEQPVLDIAKMQKNSFLFNHQNIKHFETSVTNCDVKTTKKKIYKKNRPQKTSTVCWGSVFSTVQLACG